MFSGRTPRPGLTNRLTRALAARGRPYLDLTVTNPTAASLAWPAGTLETLADPAGLVYAPDPRGLPAAREAVVRYYAERGVAASAERIVLTASSSEAYTWLLKLLAEPGDAVLVPAPSYPLLDALATLEGVELHRYALPPEDGWSVHADRVEEEVERLARSGKRTSAVVLVNPNNPTGSSIHREELAKLGAAARRRSFALISDEVFLDYRFQDRPGDAAVAAAAAGEEGALVFSLGGLSKTAALPQLKLGWILAGGGDPLLREALERLEWIADAFLSVSTPVQLALPALLASAHRVTARVRDRIAGNARALVEAFPPGGPVTPQPIRAGWSAVLRVPAVMPEEELVLFLLERHDVLVHPGYFFDFPGEAYVVVSLLPRPEPFREGLARLGAGLGT